MKEKILKLLRSEKIYIGFGCGLLISLFIIIFVYIQSFHTSSNIKQEMSYDEIVKAMDEITFSDVVSYLDYYEKNKQDADILHEYSVENDYAYDKFVEPDTNTYTFKLYYRYSDVDNLCIFNRAKEYTITKYDNFYDIAIKEYAIDENNEPINNKCIETYTQFTYSDGRLKMTIES